MNFLLLASGDGSAVSAVRIVQDTQIGKPVLGHDWSQWMLPAVVALVVVCAGLMVMWRRSHTRALRDDPEALAYRALCKAWGVKPLRGDSAYGLGLLVIERMSEK